MTTCKECKDKTCLEKGKPCQRVEVYLQSLGIKSADWIRPKMPSAIRTSGEFREKPFSSLNKKEKEIVRSKMGENPFFE